MYKTEPQNSYQKIYSSMQKVCKIGIVYCLDYDAQTTYAYEYNKFYNITKEKEWIDFYMGPTS